MQSDFKSLAHTSESRRGSADKSCYRYRSCLWPLELPAMLPICGALVRPSAQPAPVQMRAGRQLSSSLHQAVRAPAALRRAAATRQERHRRGWPAQARAADSTAPSVAAPQPRNPNPSSLSGARRACLVLFRMAFATSSTLPLLCQLGLSHLHCHSPSPCLPDARVLAVFSVWFRRAKPAKWMWRSMAAVVLGGQTATRILKGGTSLHGFLKASCCWLFHLTTHCPST